uniref:Uncharacterized protein n=1 Tax=Zea mays TaxID=4577 RepID=C4J8A4_MAIZE|nr:unknown [Zea mays]
MMTSTWSAISSARSGAMPTLASLTSPTTGTSFLAMKPS